MKLARWIWPLNVAGATAVANLACMTLLGVLYLCLLPWLVPIGFVWQPHHNPSWTLAARDVLTFGIIFLAFPAGWVSYLTDYVWGAVVFVPINAYFWGAIAHVTWRSRIQVFNSRHVALHPCSNENCSVHYMIELKQCPACGAPAPEIIPSAPEQFPDPTADETRPSAYFIMAAGVAAPAICGGVALAVLAIGEPAIMAGAALAGAAFIAFVVRWLNHRDTTARKHPGRDTSHKPGMLRRSNPG